MQDVGNDDCGLEASEQAVHTFVQINNHVPRSALYIHILSQCYSQLSLTVDANCL